jgi:hypothetical protein
MNTRRRLLIALGSAVSIPELVLAQAKRAPVVREIRAYPRANLALSMLPPDFGI